MDYFTYIINADNEGGQPRIGIPFKTNMNFLEFQDYVREQCELIHPKGRDVVWKYSTWELVNPEVMMVEDYVNFCPYILEV